MRWFLHKHWPYIESFLMTNVLLTGSSGFIGCLLRTRLLSLGHDVRAYAGKTPLPYAQCLDLTAELEPGFCSGIDTVFHLAGKAHALAETRQSADEYGQINTEGTRKLLEAARQACSVSFFSAASKPWAMVMASLWMNRSKHLPTRLMASPNTLPNNGCCTAVMCRILW